MRPLRILTRDPRRYGRSARRGCPGIQGLDDDVAAELAVIVQRLFQGIDRAVGQEPDAEFLHASPHEALVRKENAGLVADARKAHVLGDISDGADGDVRLVGDDAADVVRARVGEDVLFVPHVDQEGVADVGPEHIGDEIGRAHV